MSSSAYLRAGFAILLAAAVLLKVQLWGATDARQVDFGGGVSKLMAQHGFTVQRIEEGGDFPTVAGGAGACRLLVGSLTPFGFHRATLRRIAPPGSQVFVVYDGVRYADQPEWRTKLEHYWVRFNRVIGRVLTEPLVLGIVAWPGCEPGEIVWLDSVNLS